MISERTTNNQIMWIFHPDCGSVLSLKWGKPLAKFFCGAGS